MTCYFDVQFVPNGGLDIATFSQFQNKIMTGIILGEINEIMDSDDYFLKTTISCAIGK